VVQDSPDEVTQFSARICLQVAYEALLPNLIFGDPYQEENDGSTSGGQ